MVSVQGGTLPVGSHAEGQFVSDFQIGKYEVTWGDWKLVREWAMAQGYSDLAGVGAGIGDNYPVTNVSWYDVVKWCNAKSEKEGKTPVYHVSGTTYRTGESNPSVNAFANGYRLPIAPEIEWAASGGNQTHRYTYSGSNDINLVAWTLENSGSALHAVGTKAANELGIYDLGGNAWEWCWGVYTWNGSGGPSERRLLGGSVENAAVSAVVFNDGTSQSADIHNASFGFRVACNSGQ